MSLSVDVAELGDCKMTPEPMLLSNVTLVNRWVRKTTMNVLGRDSLTEGVDLEGLCSRTHSGGGRLVFPRQEMGMDCGHCAALDGQAE